MLKITKDKIIFCFAIISILPLLSLAIAKPPSAEEKSFAPGFEFLRDPFPTIYPDSPSQQQPYGVFSRSPNQEYGVFSRGSGASSRGDAITITNPLAGIAEDLPGLIGYILRLARYFASAIAVLVIVFGAYQILFAAGDPKKFQTGVKTIIYALIGLAVIFMGDIIVNILREITQ